MKRLLRRIFAALIVLCACSALFACKAKEQATTETPAETVSQDCKSNIILSDETDFNGDIKTLAVIYDCSPSRIALSLLICKLDDTHVFSLLTQKSSAELFEQLTEAAVENKITLETLDKNYCLKDILASDNINVKFTSNNVVYLNTNAKKDDQCSWIEKFEETIRKPEIASN